MTDIEQKVKQTFQYLHTHAEISWEETETTRYIANILKENGCEVSTFPDHTGVIGRFGNFEKGLPVVAIRADMDALWQEVNGTFQANHSCGHDAHMAMVLGVLWELKENSALHESIAIKFIFQPAEEKGTGALKMVEKGVVEDADYLFGVHLRPKQETAMHHAAPVIVHGAAKTYQAKIKGVDAHGARPHLTTNAIEVGAQIVQLLNKIHLDPTIPHSVKMTNFQAGGKSTNIIPGNASFAIDMRAQTNEAMNELDKQVIAIFESLQSLYPIEIEIIENHGIAAAKTNQEAISIMETAITNVLGKEAIVPPLITPGGDDFHFYTIKKPELKATMLGLGCDLTPGLHHPQMTFNREALMNGVHILLEAVREVYQV
ncbi:MULTISPECIES: M20 peptidase aminoacylase family protein [Virgibacillus]|uniref:Amidohydrolase n=1 Tax=Virgibacillus pantothenticus TaxID=1473 RepID=A0A0L0QLV2_VIRPA|nr:MULTISPECIES: M20 peptidase aminoacylase family protein [Virgibacillus]API93293.1 amidohydrolase [Virgibacillus sp. 6R]KNE19567.1 amidohydrolase [Virgibacillus pantothenticus]MBS7428658.1 M20 peptidase aminoacylase family protein [Virgibacillus sp. 19R1-5]MBU8565814.1 M20 peptidase aminoacylase family protein [Virgibacillus pantothenticus]MBU8599600.1 M20 peptidase aminoacylase family protein [Virgibacillus pantothenticus]